MSLRTDHLTFKYHPNTPMETTALDDVSIEIGEGEFIGLMGRTGSGKSTLIQHLNGLLEPTSGNVFFNGENIWQRGFSLRKLRSKVGLVFQYPEHQLFKETVIEDVCFGPKNLGLTDDEALDRAQEALDMVGLDNGVYHKSPFDLSGGQKRRAAIAGVLAMKPEYLILDEPTAGLDPAGRDEILTKLGELHRKKGITIVLVSHSMEDMAKYAKRLIVMDRGEVVLDGETREVFSHGTKLTSIGLAVSQVTDLSDKLRLRGIILPANLLTISEAKDAILAAFPSKAETEGEV